jgi:HSP20 family protein
MPMARWSDESDPFLAMRREMNRLFDDVFGGFGLPSVLAPAVRQMPAAPKIDVSETENEIQIKAEMPGIDPNDVEVLLEDDRLIIRGETREEREDKDRNYHLRERVQGAFSRTLPLPFTPDPNQVRAEFRNGVMTITVPKPQEVKQKQHRIDVQQDQGASGEASGSATGASTSGQPSGSRSDTTASSEPSVSRAGRGAGATSSGATTSGAGSSQSQAEQREKETAAE